METYDRHGGSDPIAALRVSRAMAALNDLPEICIAL